MKLLCLKIEIEDTSYYYLSSFKRSTKIRLMKKHASAEIQSCNSLASMKYN